MADVVTFAEIIDEISKHLYDEKCRWFSTPDITNSLQDQYNRAVAQLCPIEKSALVPQQSHPYYNFKAIPDFMYVVGIYNSVTNRWLEGATYKQYKGNFQTYLNIGQPRYFDIMDNYRLLIWPYLNAATGALYVLYKATAPLVDIAQAPILPYSTGAKILIYMSLIDLFEQKREFAKASKYFAKLYTPISNGSLSVWEQCKKEIKDLASMDRERVLEPYRWLFHSGTGAVISTGTGDSGEGGGGGIDPPPPPPPPPTEMAWISGETPSGIVNDINANFTLAGTPNPALSLILTRNGQVLTQGGDYNLVGNAITMIGTAIPLVGDVLRAWYQVA